MQKLSLKYLLVTFLLVLKTEQPTISQKGLCVISALHFKSPEGEAGHHVLHTVAFHTKLFT